MDEHPSFTICDAGDRGQRKFAGNESRGEGQKGEPSWRPKVLGSYGKDSLRVRPT